ncbi:MAG: hypothetical protein WC829_11175 [Hyphomicrobium sp.]|jgi:hypothetical protein
MSFNIERAATRFAQLLDDGTIQIPASPAKLNAEQIREIAELVEAPEPLVEAWVLNLQRRR